MDYLNAKRFSKDLKIKKKMMLHALTYGKADIRPDFKSLSQDHFDRLFK
jgi:hypothetical protein